MRRTRWLLLAMWVAVGSGCTSHISDTPLAFRLGDGAEIPEGHATYVLFLNASTEYPDRSAPDKLKTLERQFKAFGDSIGNSRLAVWVNDAGSPALSVSRGKYYVDLIARWTRKPIAYSDGPFVIISSRHPRELANAPPPNATDPAAVVISFSGIGADRIVEVLNLLEARIRRDEALTPAQFQMAVFWVRLQSWWDTTDHEFFKKVALTVIEKAL
jgi:hypothetical protein